MKKNREKDKKSKKFTWVYILKITNPFNLMCVCNGWCLDFALNISIWKKVRFYSSSPSFSSPLAFVRFTYFATVLEFYYMEWRECLSLCSKELHSIFSLVPFIVSLDIWTYSIETYYVVLYGAVSHHLQAKHTKLWLCLNRTLALALM